MTKLTFLKELMLTLVWVGRVILPTTPSPRSPCWFSLNNSEKVRAISLEFCSIQQLFIRNICAKFGISNSLQSPDIGQNSDGGNSNFQISGQSFINQNCHNSRTIHDIDKKLGPVTKLDKSSTSTSKNLAMTSFLQIVTLLSFFRFRANFQPSESGIPGAWSIELTFSLIVTFYLTEPENRSKELLTQLFYYISLPKNADFLQNKC